MQNIENPRLANNNFDLIRLLLAGTVCLAHAHELSGFDEIAWFRHVFSASIAVQAFFVISGFLIFMSYEKSSSISSYARKRIRRIYPAYFSVVALCAFGLLSISTLSTEAYFSTQWFKYLGANLTFLNFIKPTLPGVFEGLRYQTVNGALWTLKLEVMFYVVVPLFVVLFRRFGHLKCIAVTYILSVAYNVAFSIAAQKTGSAFYLELGKQLPGQLCYFMAGGLLYYYLSFFERHVGYFVAAAAVVLGVNSFIPLSALTPLAVAVFVIFFALFLYVGNFGKYGDFSYGVYILHFPIIQTLLYSGHFNQSPWLYLISAVGITLLGAVAMWHLVEKQFLFRNSHYVASTAAA